MNLSKSYTTAILTHLNSFSLNFKYLYDQIDFIIKTTIKTILKHGPPDWWHTGPSLAQPHRECWGVIYMASKKWKFLVSIVGFIGCFMFSACGGAVYEKNGTSSDGSTNTAPPCEGQSCTNTQETTNDHSAISNEDTNDLDTPNLPPLTFEVSNVGYTEVSIQVKTTKILKVKFVPATQSSMVTNSGYAPQYSKLGVYIAVGSQDRPTPLLSNGLMEAAKESPIMDFSASINEATADDEVKITVHKPNYDYWCLMGYYNLCPYTHVYETHPWSGTLIVQTDETEELKAENNNLPTYGF